MLDRKRENVTHPALGLNDARGARVRLKLAPQPQNLDVYAAVEDILVHAGCLQQMLAAERPLGRVEKRRQQGVFALGQWDKTSARVAEAPGAAVELPAAKPASNPLGIPLRGRACDVLPPQHGTNACQKFAQAEGLGDIVIRA